MVSRDPGLSTPCMPSNSVVKPRIVKEVEIPNSKSSELYDKIKSAHAIAEKAVKENRIFTILGPYPTVRRCLLSRQWAEKLYYSPRKNACAVQTAAETDDETEEIGYNRSVGILKSGRFVLMGTTAAISNNAEKTICLYEGGVIPHTDGRITENLQNVISRFVRNIQPCFIWTRRRDDVNFKNLQKDQIVNHFPVSEFTTKIGLSKCLHKLRWFQDADADTFFPRCYKIGMEDDRKAFIDDYHLTACIGIIKWVVHYVQTSVPKRYTLIPETDCIPARAAELALQYCESFIKFKKHEDIDFEETKLFTEKQWLMLMGWYYKLINEGALISKANTVYEQCFTMLINIKPYWPQIEMDGINNIWIIKPGAKSRGIGIKILQNLEEILDAVECNEGAKTDKFIVQKYIERPLLVHSTKFDIRQWFLVTDWNPLTIFFYRESYIRFCSKTFSLFDRSEAGHLCNNSIQKNYFHHNSKSCLIPDEFMWSSDEFKSFLQQRGKRSVWEKIIYPGMKNAIIATMVSAQDGVDFRKGCFELYGADFMLTEDYQPWLIEINSSPCLAATTKVTGKLCPMVIEDTIKVVLDRRDNKTCPIGKFELVYKQVPIILPHYVGINLTVQGVAIIKPEYCRCEEDLISNLIVKSSSSKSLLEADDEETKKFHPLRIKFISPLELKKQAYKTNDKPPLTDVVRMNNFTAVKQFLTSSGPKLEDMAAMQISGVAIKVQYRNSTVSKSSKESSFFHSNVSSISEASRIRKAMTASVTSTKSARKKEQYSEIKDGPSVAPLFITGIGKTTLRPTFPNLKNKWVLSPQQIYNPDARIYDASTFLKSNSIPSSPLTSLLKNSSTPRSSVASLQNTWKRSSLMPLNTAAARQAAARTFSSNLLWADTYGCVDCPFNHSSVRIMPMWSGAFNCSITSDKRSPIPSFRAKKVDRPPSDKVESVKNT